jgi:hypothetical protein
MPAGHPGNHSISIEWTDDECFSPMAVPSVATPPFAGADNAEIMQQISRAEAAWENRDRNVDHEALAELDFGTPALPPVQVDARCVACDHQHANGKCRCGCETFIARLQ